MQGCPHPPTPNPHQTLRARAATAAQLAASAVGPTAGAARQPRSSPRKAGVQPGLHVWAYDVPRAACASSGAPKRWLAADVTTFASIYMELRPARLRGGFLRVCHLHFDLDGRSAGSTPCLRRRRGGDGRVMRAHFSIPNPNSRFSFHKGLAVYGDFLISVCRLPNETGIHHYNSLFLLLASSAGLRAVGPIIKFQDAEKMNSQKRSEIPNSTEEIATPSRKCPHRTLPVIRNPLADPNGAPGESRPS